MSSLTVHSVPGLWNNSENFYLVVISCNFHHFVRVMYSYLYFYPLLGVLVPVSASSDAFLNSVVAPLKSAYLYEESKQSFRYKSAVLVKNPALEEKVSQKKLTHHMSHHVDDINSKSHLMVKLKCTWFDGKNRNILLNMPFPVVSVALNT